MNYKDLPLEQRMELASQYALLLLADNKPVPDILRRLRTDYALSEEQASQAFGAMRTNYKDEYNSTLNSNLFKALVALLASGFLVLVYYFMGKEMGGAGTLAFAFVILFGIAGVGAIIMTGRILEERFNRLIASIRDAFTRPAAEQDAIDKILAKVVGPSFLLLCIAAAAYFLKSGTVDLKKVITIDNCIIAEPVRYEVTYGKGARRWYVFKFMGHNLELRFYDTYYKYSSTPPVVPGELKMGDTVSIQFPDQGAANDYQYSLNTEGLDIINLGQHGRFMVDLDYRNACYIKDRKRFFYISLAVFAVVIPVIFLKNRFYNKKPHRQPPI